MTASPAQENTARTVKDAAQIVDIIGECVALKRAGATLKGLCPFHAEKTPSFIVSPERQTFHCFGCGEGGDVFTFMEKYHRMTFSEALKELAQRYHIQLPEKQYSPADQEKTKNREKLFSANERSAALYHEFLLQDPAAAKARAYLEKRGLPLEIIKQFKIGYAPDSWDYLTQRITQANFSLGIAVEAGLLIKKEQGGYYDRFRDRVMFPIFDLSGKVAGFGGRILGDGQPKYLNSPETPVFDKGRILFGLYQSRLAIRQKKRCLIVEGNFDLLSLIARGVDYVAAPLGTALTQGQIRLLRGYADEAVLLFDGDEAGLKAALRAVPLFIAEQVRALVSVLPSNHDPDTFIAEFGREGLEAHLKEAKPLLEFVFDRLVNSFGLSLEGKGKILNELRPLIESSASDPVQQSVLVSHFSERLQLDPEQILKGFQDASHTMKGRGATGQQEKVRKKVSLSRVQQQLLEFIILHPQSLDRFLDKGIEKMLDGSASIILEKMREIAGAASFVPERLLEVLPDGPERSFVSELLITAPSYGANDSDAIIEKMILEKLAWLEKNTLSSDITALTEKIEAAKQAGDDDLLLQLSTRKIELNQALKAVSKGKRH